MSRAAEGGQAAAPPDAESIYRQYGEQVLIFVRGRFGPANADDIASRVWEKLASGRLPDPDRPAMPWLRTVALRAGFDHLRAEPSTKPLDIDLDAPEMDDRVARVHDRIILDGALADLTEVERDSVALFAEGWSPAEIGALHGRSPHAIHCLKSRTCERLRLLLGQAMLPVFALLGLIRRGLCHVQPTTTATMAVEAVIMAALVLGAPDIGNGGRFPPSHAIADAPTDKLIAARNQPHPSGTGAGPTDLQALEPGRTDARDEPAVPREPGVTVDKDDGAAAPRYISGQQPTVETPYGPAGRGRTEAECMTPRDFDVVPRNDEIYRLC